MAIPRKEALKRLKGHAPTIEKHFRKIAADPTNWSVLHWIGEINEWIRQMEEVLPHVGVKTAQKWRAQIEEWNAKLRS